MITQPKVSVVIPAYNHEKYIGRAIDSILNQIYENIELIIIDDGSSDNTWTVISEYRARCEERFSDTRFIRQKNSGAYVTLNKLISCATGKYVFFIASDDVASHDAILLFVDYLENNSDYVLVVGENAIVDAYGKRCYWDKDRKNIYDPRNAVYMTFTDFLEVRSKDRLDSFDSNNFGSYETLLLGNYIPNGFLIRKCVLDRLVVCNDEVLLEDWFLVLQVAKYGKMKFLRRLTYYYRWHSRNTVKDAEKMQDLTKKTFTYEVMLLRSKFKDLYDSVSDGISKKRRKYFLNSRWLKIYKSRNIELKMFCFDILGKQFAFVYKKII